MFSFGEGSITLYPARTLGSFSFVILGISLRNVRETVGKLVGHLPVVNVVFVKKFQNFPQSSILSLPTFFGWKEGVNDILQLILCS